MSIINFKKGQISDNEYLANARNVKTDVLIGRSYDNNVDSLLGKNFDELLRVNLDLFEDEYFNLIKNILEFNKYRNHMDYVNSELRNAREQLVKEETNLTVANIQDSKNVKTYILDKDIKKSDVVKIVDEKKRLVESVEGLREKLTSILTYKSQISDTMSSLLLSINSSYSFMNKIYDDLGIADDQKFASRIKDFDEISEEEFVDRLPYGIYKDQLYFYNELKSTIYYELAFIKELCEELPFLNQLYYKDGIDSLFKLSDEQLVKINKSYYKNSVIRKALDVKYDALKKSFIDASNKSLDNRRSRRAHINNVHSYKKVLMLLNEYIDLVEFDRKDELTEDMIESVDQSLGSLYNTENVDVSARSVSELYQKEYIRNAEEYNYLSSPLLR